MGLLITVPRPESVSLLPMLALLTALLLPLPQLEAVTVFVLGAAAVVVSYMIPVN